VFKDDKQRRNTATGGQQKAEQSVTNVDENLILLKNLPKKVEVKPSTYHIK